MDGPRTKEHQHVSIHHLQNCSSRDRMLFPVQMTVVLLVPSKPETAITLEK